MRVLARRPGPPAPSARAHNRVLRAAERRALDLEDRLVELLTPVLEDAGDVAARNFEARATRRRLSQAFPILAAASSPASTMIAVKPSPVEAQAIAEPGGDPAEVLHVTLCFLGQTEGDLSQVSDALAGVPGAHAPLEGQVGGVGSFADNGSGYPAILLPSVPGLLELRHHVAEALTAAGIEYGRDHGFVPHMTVAYRQDGARPPDADRLGIPLTFDELWVVRGDVETVRLPLTGGKPLTAAALDAWFAEFDAGDVVARIAEVAAEHAPDGGYGDAWWNEAQATVFWNAADWSSDDEVDAAVAAFLDVQGVDWVETDSEVGWPDGEGWARAWPPGKPTDRQASLVAAADNEFCLPSTVRTKTDPVRQAVAQTVVRAGVEGAGISFDVTNPLAGKVLARSASQVQGIAQTTQLDVMKVIKAAYEEGLSIPDTADSIRAFMREAAPWRARMIARTELAGAVNGASLAATQIVDETVGGGQYRKVWMTAPGAKYPRHEDYEGLDGQTADLHAPFDVGDSELQFPGDPDGAPEETINCRCAMRYDDGADSGGASLEAAAIAEPCWAHSPRPGTLVWVAPSDVEAELASVVASLTAAGPADWSSPAPEEILRVHCEPLPAAPVAEPPAPARAETMPAAAPERAVGDTVSVMTGAPVPAEYVTRINQLGLNSWSPPMGPAAERIFAGGYTSTKNLYTVAGDWTTERAALHEAIKERIFEGKVAPPPGERQALFTAGGGASGKGSIRFDVQGRQVGTEELGKRADTVLIDPDGIKAMLPEYQEMRAAGDAFAASGVHEESSAIANEVLKEAQARGLSIVYDSTGSSARFMEKVAQLRGAGYETQVQMVSVPTNEAIARSIVRASNPDSDSFRRYVIIPALKDAHAGASAQLADWMTRPEIGRWQLVDTSTHPPTLVAEGGAGADPTVYDETRMREILAKADEK